ncbi:TonB-dependent receptor [Pseudohalioglobus lutimaris]|uniref:TonB-dependent receptor n=2 Tax=Pseudohalioglobus lutimaris TaxID=1737061 RepID=A0A2N5X512_9GAMM|nr:TonB-dependent receptor [Pseudohalioglobus lutimaris]
MQILKYRGYPVSVLSLAVAAAIGSSPVFSQVTGLEEVVVTAQKREESLQETPISITALGESAIENRGVANTEDLMGQIPGLSGFSSPGSRSAVALNMRGIIGGSPANLSIDPAIALYMNGVYIGKQVGSAMDVAEIERIEVLRGPQGTLYGRNSTGGAVNVITRKPTGEFGLRATASIGNYDSRQFKVNLDTPAIGQVGEGLGELALNFGYQTRLQDALYDNDSPGGDDFDDIDRQAWQIAARWTFSDSFHVDYSYDESELDEALPLQQTVGFTKVDAAGTIGRIDAMQGLVAAAQNWATIPGSDPRLTERWIPSLQETISAYQKAEAQGQGRASSGRADFSPSTYNEVSGHSLTLEWDAGNLGALGDVSFRSISARRELETFVTGDLEDIDSRIDEDGIGAYSDLVHLTLGQFYAGSSGFAFPLLDGLWSAIDSGGAFHTLQNTLTNYDQWSQELQMVGSTDRLNYVLGVYYFEDEGEYRRNATFAAPLNGIGADQYYDNATDALAFFAQATWTPGWLDERLSLTGGLRYTEEEKSIDYNYGEVVTPFGVTPAMSVSREEEFDNISGNFTVSYQASDDINTYLTYSTGYRSGGFNGEIFDNSYDEETIEQYEIGLKSDWWDNRLRVNASLYSYTYDDLQVTQSKVVNGAATTQIANAGAAERWGGEIEVTAAPVEDLIVSFSYAYIHGDFEEYGQICGTNVPITCLDTTDDARRQSPDTQVNLALDYIFGRTGFGDIRGYVQVNYQSESVENALWSGVVGGDPVIYDQIGMDARTLVDARLSLENIRFGDSTLRVTLWGKNLLDDDYPTYSINFGGLGLVTEQYGPPRTYGLEFSYEY